MDKCGNAHPRYPDVLCGRAGAGLAANHYEHTGLIDGKYVDWRNENYEPTDREKEIEAKRKNKKILTDIAARVRGSAPK